LKGVGQKRLEEAANVLRSCGHELTLAPTTGPGTAGGIARQWIEKGVEMVIVSGGDGTINEVVEGMLHSPVPLAVLPAGTANVLANETGMSTSLEKAARALADYRPQRIAVGRLHASGAAAPRHFLLMAGVGLDARIVYNVSAGLKRKVGKLAYWAAAMSVIGRDLEEFDVKADGAIHKCSFALVSRVRNYGGDFEIACQTRLMDDAFEVVLFEGRSSARYLKYFTGVALKRLQGMKGVTVLRARKVCMSGVNDPRVHIQVDGEYAGRLPASIEIVPDALTLLLPPGYSQPIAK
jgi:diacylglycerol kinase (ATP)